VSEIWRCGVYLVGALPEPLIVILSEAKNRSVLAQKTEERFFASLRMTNLMLTTRPYPAAALICPVPPRGASDSNLDELRPFPHNRAITISRRNRG
jgi:hypothetical protein